MEIFYSPYKITPLKRLNRSSNLEPKEGIHLKAVLGSDVSFADYFPHLHFGDKGCEKFLSEFKFQKDEYDRKVLHLLNKDRDYQKQSYKKFYNHQLWSGAEDLEAPIVKYKLLKVGDSTFLDPLKRGIRIRLDANGLFTNSTFSDFIRSIPLELLKLIDYVEDPSPDSEWSGYEGVKLASDLFDGKTCDLFIHRPNCKFIRKTDKSQIFSAYLGGDFGRWHAYSEMIELGDLNQTHGILYDGYYKEQGRFLSGSYLDGFLPIEQEIKNLYQDLSDKEWKLLCSI